MIDEATSVVNMRYNKADVNCGRGSFFGNPYKIGVDGTRDEVCDKYATLFRKRLQDPTFRAKVLLLKGRKLGCWCKPLRCHVDTIKSYLDNET